MELDSTGLDGYVKVNHDSLEIEYWSQFLSDAEATELLEALLGETRWAQADLAMYGKRVKMPRLTCWYGEPNAIYVYSGVRNEPLPWTPRLRSLKDKIEPLVSASFNSVLLNLYRDGNDYMSWHSDDEWELGSRPTIASVSVGVPRRFEFRQSRRQPGGTRKEYSIELAHGSLLLMMGETQRVWQHGIAKARGLGKPRINLTFRKIVSTKKRLVC